MKKQAELGCVPCGILSEGIEKVLHDEESQAGVERSQAGDGGDWELRLDFNIHGAERSLVFVVIGTGTVVTFFRSEGISPYLLDPIAYRECNSNDSKSLHGSPRYYQIYQ